MKTRLALEAVLLFHSAGHWDKHKAARRQTICSSIIARPEPHQGSPHPDGFRFAATTRVLCDLARAALAGSEKIQ